MRSATGQPLPALLAAWSHTQLAIVGALDGRAGRGGSIRGARGHQAVACPGVGVAALRRAVGAPVLHIVAAPAIFGGRSQRVVRLPRARPTWLQAHAVHACGGPLHLEVAQLRLEIFNVPVAVLDLAVQPREHGGVVGRLAHGIGGVDQGPLAVNLLLHARDGIVDVRHGGGGLRGPAVEAWRLSLRQRLWGGGVPGNGGCVQDASTPKRAPVVRGLSPGGRVRSPGARRR
jgi:hypothetical protein